MDPYGELGLRPVLNAAATLTSLGGTPLPEEVVEAMAGAARSCVDMGELHRAAGERLAQLTGNQAAYVTNGCASGIVLGLLGVTTGGDPTRLPTRGEAPLSAPAAVPGVVMHRAHRIPYDWAVSLAGARIVEIGDAIQTFPYELESALERGAVAVLYVAGAHLSPAAALSLEETVTIAHRRGVPVLVDAAAQLPPVSNLWRFTAGAGADLALFSGGKALRGPQSSGLMVGEPALVAAARANGSPNQLLARALKVGKEEICGLVAAVERYLALDHEGLARHHEEVVASWVGALQGVPGVSARRSFPNEAGQPVPRLELSLDPAVAGLRAEELAGRLWSGDPRVAVLSGGEDRLFLTPDTLFGERAEERVLEALLGALARAPGRVLAP